MRFCFLVRCYACWLTRRRDLESYLCPQSQVGLFWRSLALSVWARPERAPGDCSTNSKKNDRLTTNSEVQGTLQPKGPTSGGTLISTRPCPSRISQLYQEPASLKRRIFEEPRPLWGCRIKDYKLVRRVRSAILLVTLMSPQAEQTLLLIIIIYLDCPRGRVTDELCGLQM